MSQPEFEDLVPFYKIAYSKILKRGKSDKYSPTFQLLKDINRRLTEIGIPEGIANNSTVYCSRATFDLWCEKEFKWLVKNNNGFLKKKYLREQANIQFIFNSPIFIDNLELNVIYLSKEQNAYRTKQGALYYGSTGEGK
jgi:hypothetical protein